MNIIKNGLAKIFNRFSCRHLENVVAELSGRYSDYSHEDLIKTIGRANKFANLASRFGYRSVATEDVSTVSKLCMARAAQQLLDEIERTKLFKEMNLLRDAKGPMVEVLGIRRSSYNATAALDAIDVLQKRCYEITDRLHNLLVRAGLSDSDDDALSQKITGIIDRMGFWRENFPSDGEFDEFMSNANKWLGLTIADKIEKLKSYTSPCPK